MKTLVQEAEMKRNSCKGIKYRKALNSLKRMEARRRKKKHSKPMNSTRGKKRAEALKALQNL